MNQQQFNTDKIDKHLGADFDAEQAWKEFDEKQNKKRPILFFWWFGLILLIGITTVCLQKMKNKEHVNISQSQIKENFKTQEAFVPAISEQNRLLENKESLVEEKANSKNVATSLLSSPTPSIAKNTVTETQNKTKDFIGTRPNSSDLMLSKNTNIPITDNTLPDNRTSPLNAFVNRVADTSTKTFEEKATIEPIVALQENFRKDADTAKEEELYIDHIATIPVAKIDKRLGFPLISMQKPLQNIPLTVPQNSSVNSNKSVYSFNLYSSAGVMQRNLDANTDKFQLRRVNNEMPLYRYAFGALVSKRITSTFKVSIGLEYNNYVTRIEDLIQNVGQSTIVENRLIAYQLRGGVSEPVYGNVPVTTVEVVKNIRYQQYRSVAIPVNVSYIKELNKGFSLEAGMGFSYHLSMSAIGKTYKEDGTIGAYQSLSNLPYRTAHLIDFNLHTGIHKTVSDQLSLGLRATYNRDLNSRILPSSNFTDKFSSLNLELSLTRYF